jgi:hypothetical protein
MTKTSHGRLLTLNREPIFDGFVTVATHENGRGAFKPEHRTEMEIPLHEPLILEEIETDRIVIVERVEGVPPVAFFYRG